MRRPGLPAALLTASLTIGLLQSPAAGAPPASPTVGRAATATTDVTLITGDRVVTHGRTTSVQPGPGRKGIRFLTQSIGSHRYVIPADALAPLRAGSVDKRLFDVADQAGTGKELRLLIAYAQGGVTKARSAITAGGARVTRDIPVLRTLAVRADLTGRASVWQAVTAGTGVRRVWLDGRRKVSLDHSVPQIGAPAAWQAGLDGTGVRVAILDTGIDQTHPDLAGQIAETANFTTTPTVDDEVGHGTHVASIIAGTGAASGGRYRGVAPGAKLLIGKVCETEFCDDSAILAGMAWAAQRAPVVNMSLGGGDTPGTDPLEQAVEDLTRQYDTLFVVAAGNDGDEGTVESPSTADAALSVGAVDRDDQLAYFSSRGPRAGDHALKPDITAPGVEIVAAKAAHGTIGDPAPVDGYTTLSGTSMATPHVAGAAAILTQQHPGWSSALRKNTLLASAKPTAGLSVFAQGAGRVDVAREITQTVTADEGSLSFGVQAWPHDDDKPIVKTVTYRNSGTRPVALALAGPGGPFTVADTALTVPAGGTASTTVTADTRGDIADGLLGGDLTATGDDGVRVETALGVEREVESYNVTIRTSVPDHLVSLYNVDTNRSYDAFQAAGTEVVRIPKGRYAVYAWLFPDDHTSAMLTDTERVVDRDGTLTADLAAAAPVVVKSPIAGSVASLAALTAAWTLPDSGLQAGLLAENFDGLLAGPLSGVSKPGYRAIVNGSFAAPGPDGTFRNSPYQVDLAYSATGRMFHGLHRAPALKDLAAVRSTFAVQATGAQADKTNFADFGDGSAGWAVVIPFDLPFRRTDYLNADARWSGEFMEELPSAGDNLPATITDLFSAAKPYRAGHTYREDWNRGASGPSVTAPPGPWQWVSRQGDHLVADVPPFGDGAGHPGFSTTDGLTVALYKGRVKIGDGYEYDLPPGAATYRLEMSATRGAPHRLATSVSGVWTFRSGHVAGADPVRLPLSTVRFSPAVDDHNTVAGARYADLPVTVDHQAGSGATTARSVRVWVSYDDGRTWRAAPLRGSGDHRTATVWQPRAGFVSLRATAEDTHGNAVTQTVLRAYAIR
jgi:subtilisin family serine protease